MSQTGSATIARILPAKGATGSVPSGFGWHGRYLEIDLGRESSAGLAARAVVFPEDVLHRFIGGVALGGWLLVRHTPPRIDPFAPEAPLVLAFSPLVGSPLTTSAKFAVLCKSPLTERINESLCSSRFALAGKRTGFDAVVVRGRAERPSVLWIGPAAVRLEPAGDLWGLTVEETEAQLAASLPPGAAALVIGPAGERRVRFATATHDGRHLGRGGTGAVLGAKQLKAIVVDGDVHPRTAHPDRAGALARWLHAASLGPATEKYRHLGTMGNLAALERLHVLPRRNFQSVPGVPEEGWTNRGASESTGAIAAQLGREALEEAFPIVRKTCAACEVACEHRLVRPRASEGNGRATGDGAKRDGSAGAVRMEYENVYALGPLCGIDDPHTVVAASELCDRLGLDTISAGATLAFAMEAAERGWWPECGLAFGDGTLLLESLEAIAQRRGVVGDRLADGTRRLAERLGPEAMRAAPHIKGLELPGFDPRTMQHLALGMAVAARGADHNRSGAYEADLSGRHDRLRLSVASAEEVWRYENEAVLYDSLILCKFIRRALGEDPVGLMGEMLGAVTGWFPSRAWLLSVAQRAVTTRRWYNLGQGARFEEDTLPARFFEEPIRVGTQSVVVDRAMFERARGRYYALRGWDARGIPREPALAVAAAWPSHRALES